MDDDDDNAVDIAVNDNYLDDDDVSVMICIVVILVISTGMIELMTENSHLFPFLFLRSNIQNKVVGLCKILKIFGP